MSKTMKADIGRFCNLSIIVLVSCIWHPTVAVCADDPTLPTIKPKILATIDIKRWESTESRFGGRKIDYFGGTEVDKSQQRRFALSPDGKMLATQDYETWDMEIWDTSTGKLLTRIDDILYPAALAYSPDGKTVATATSVFQYRQFVNLWDVSKRERNAKLTEGLSEVPLSAVAFSPDGKTLALARCQGRNNDGLDILLWDVSRGKKARELAGAGEPVSCLAYAPDGRSLAIVCGSQVMLCEIATGKMRSLVATLPPVYSPGQPLSNSALAVAISPDNRLVAVGCVDGVVRCWETLSGKELLPFAGHKGKVVALQFSPEAHKLWSFGQDKHLLEWSVKDAGQQSIAPDRDVSTDFLKGRWEALGGPDNQARELAIGALAAVPRQTLALLRDRLHPVPALEPGHIEDLITQLGGADYNARKLAAAELRKLDDRAVPALRKKIHPDDDDSRAVDPAVVALLEKLEARYPPPEQVPSLHALRVLEQIGNKEARGLLKELAAGAPESVLTQCAAATLARIPNAQPPLIEDIPETAKLAELWSRLTSDDPAAGYRAMGLLMNRAKESVPFLAERLQGPAIQEMPDDDPKRIARLIADLDSDDATIRETGTRELSALGTAAADALRAAGKKGSASEEARTRIDLLLRNIDKPVPSPAQLQVVRSLEVLERIGTPEAREALERLAREAKNKLVKDAIAQTLERMPK